MSMPTMVNVHGVTTVIFGVIGFSFGVSGISFGVPIPEREVTAIIFGVVPKAAQKGLKRFTNLVHYYFCV